MPNWATGRIRIVGDARKILNFVKKDVDPNATITLRFVDFSKEGDVEIPIHTAGDWCHIKPTNRCYITSDIVGTCYYATLNKLVCAVEANIQCAWDIDLDGFKILSRNYGLRFLGRVDEEGCGFEHTIECNNGFVLSDVVEDIEESEEDEE